MFVIIRLDPLPPIGCAFNLLGEVKRNFDRSAVKPVPSQRFLRFFSNRAIGGRRALADLFGEGDDDAFGAVEVAEARRVLVL